MFADLPGRRAATVGVTVLPAQRGRFARPSTRSAYRYTPSGSSPAQIVPPCISPFRYDPDRGRAWHLGSSARCFGASASLPRQAPPLPSSSRRHAPQCFVGGYASLPCDVSHRASDEPRRCLSLSSALDPSSLASPSIRRVFFAASALVGVQPARLTLFAYPPERSGVAEGELNAGCKSVATLTLTLSDPNPTLPFLRVMTRSRNFQNPALAICKGILL